MFQHDRMAGDLPARIEPHLALGIRKHLDALGIEAVEAGIGQHAPMRGLKIVQSVDLAIAGEMAGGVGEGLERCEKIAKACLQAGFERRPIAAHELALVIIETGEAQAIEQAACLRSSA